MRSCLFDNFFFQAEDGIRDRDVTGVQTCALPISPGPDNPGHSLVLYGQQLLNYVQYFTWQFGRDWLPGIGRALAVLFGALGLLGARRHWRADRRAAVAMTTLLLTLTVALVFYLNFKWGYSQAFGGAGLEHEARE